MTIDNVILGEDLDPAWGNAVANKLNNLADNVAFGTGSGTTSAGGSVSVAHGLSWTPSAVVVAPISPNGGSVNDRWTGFGGVAVDSTNVTIGRCIHQDDSIVASKAVEFFWIAVA